MKRDRPQFKSKNKKINKNGVAKKPLIFIYAFSGVRLNLLTAMIAKIKMISGTVTPTANTFCNWMRYSCISILNVNLCDIIRAQKA
jgi:hypothetical protein